MVSPRSSLGWLLRCVLVASALVATDVHAEKRYALMIVANARWANDRPLRDAEFDAQHVRDLLVELGGFAGDRVALLKDPDTADVRARLRQLAQALPGMPSDSFVFFYYSGHADEQHLHLRGAPSSDAELYQSLRDFPSTFRVAVLDACQSGGFALLTSSGADERS